MLITSVGPTTETASLPEQLDKILPVAFIVSLIAAEIWMLLTLIHYGFKSGKWKHVHCGNSDKLNSGNVYSAVVACLVFTMFYSIVTLVYINVGFSLGEDELCDSLADAVSFFFALIYMTAQTCWWLRQRIFYTNRMMNVNYSKRVKLFSAISIIILYATGISILVFIAHPNDHPSSLDGCLFMPDNGIRVGYWISVVIAIAFGQTTLLGLLVHALAQTKNQDRRSSMKIVEELCFCPKSNSTQQQTSRNDAKLFVGSSPTPRSNNFQLAHQHSQTRKSKALTIRKILCKTIIFAIISMLSTLFFLVFIHHISNPKGHRRIAVVIGNLNAFVNLLLLLFSFTEYRKMLTSLFKMCHSFFGKHDQNLRCPDDPRKI